MNIIWTDSALNDIARLFKFLLPLNPLVAEAFVDMILAAPDRLVTTPRLGERVDRPGEEEVRRMFVRHYEMRYEIDGEDLYVLRIFHTREDR